MSPYFTIMTNLVAFAALTLYQIARPDSMFVLDLYYQTCSFVYYFPVYLNIKCTPPKIKRMFWAFIFLFRTCETIWD